MSYKYIKYEVEERILTITLNRPHRLNAFVRAMREEIIVALDRAEEDDNIRAIIITGAGRGFSAGMDLEEGGSTFNYDEVSQDEHRDGGGILALRIYRLKKPIIAAINGPAVGIGLTMTLPMDIRIASTTAKMGIVFVRRGIVVDACASWFLPRVIGIGNALEWALTGKVFTAQEALACGLVSRVVEPSEVLPAARDIALEMVRNSAPVSLALTRQLLWSMTAANHPMEAHRLESKAYHWLGQQRDAGEGISAFLEKRLPNFTMSAQNDMPDFYPWSPEPPFKPSE
ncbi:MAG: crotonase/enoyl-CoA hydratase family protein [Syntrophomonadaceae bacterium]|jgi:enoyl-CoA hydratase/carnithine racemase|nr:crotonase/enoyl-CoA hydratase family protein [Syntrophomonadaceae bacterium]